MFKIRSTCKSGRYLRCRTEPPHPHRNKMGLCDLHRVVMENKIGRLLRKGEVVHHIDGNPLNNSPENLEIHTAESHAALHSKTVERVAAVCPSCGREFEKRAAFLVTRARLNESKMVCCSRSCSVTEQWKRYRKKKAASLVQRQE